MKVYEREFKKIVLLLMGKLNGLSYCTCFVSMLRSTIHCISLEHKYLVFAP